MEPQSRWVFPLGPVETPDSIGISTKGDLYIYIHTYMTNTQFLSKLGARFARVEVVTVLVLAQQAENHKKLRKYLIVN